MRPKIATCSSAKWKLLSITSTNHASTFGNRLHAWTLQRVERSKECREREQLRAFITSWGFTRDTCMNAHTCAHIYTDTHTAQGWFQHREMCWPAVSRSQGQQNTKHKRSSLRGYFPSLHTHVKTVCLSAPVWALRTKNFTSVFIFLALIDCASLSFPKISMSWFVSQ